MSSNMTFTKDNLEICFSKLAREFKRINGKDVSAEIILVGGASAIINYDFREMSYDVDAIIYSTASMKEAINKVGDEMDLPNRWINTDFMKTKSYSPKLTQYSKYYKRYGHVLDIRTVTGEYLIAMKLMAARQYKNDISDVLGILYDEQEQGNPISIEDIKTAVQNLYGDWDNLPEHSRDFINEVFRTGQFDVLYQQHKMNEAHTKEALIDFQEQYPGVTNETNINDIIDGLRKKKSENR